MSSTGKETTSAPHPTKYPFKPVVTEINITSPSQTRRSVTIPHLPELYYTRRQLLEQIATPTSRPSIVQVAKAAAKDKSVSQLAVQNAAALNPFMGALLETRNHTRSSKGAAAFKSTGNAVLDAFIGLNEKTSPESYNLLLLRSWRSNPDLTLRVIWNLRSIHEGKSARIPFYRAFSWLYVDHPQTAIANLKELVRPVIKRVVKRAAVPETFSSNDKGPEDEDEDLVIVTLEDVDEDNTKERTATDVKETEEIFEDTTIGLPHGYWKDLLNILLLAATDELHPCSNFAALSAERPPPKTWKERKAYNRFRPVRPRTKFPPPFGKKETSPERKKRETLMAEERQSRIELSLRKDKKISRDAQQVELPGKYRRWNTKLCTKLKTDKNFRLLYATVAQLFAEALARDIGLLHEIADKDTSPEKKVELAYKITLAGKWAPTAGGAHDRVTCITTAIAELLYTNGHLPLPNFPFAQPLSSDVAHKLRSAYTRWVTSPLRRFLQVPEIRMSAGEWDKIKYTRVPSKCMQINKEHFYAHDDIGFEEYLNQVYKGKKKISGATLLPHQLLVEATRAVQLSDLRGMTLVGEKLLDISRQVVEAQWKTMVENVRKSGVLENCLAICDVSQGMGVFNVKTHSKSPIFPAVALTMLMAELAPYPWHNSFITFSDQPEVISFQGDLTLQERALQIAVPVQKGDTNHSDLNGVFMDLILPIGQKLPEEDMIKRLFIFTNMQFDNSRPKSSKNRSRSSHWATEHQLIERAFKKAHVKLPEIVYWNLAGDVVKPVTKRDQKVAFMSGFSPALMKALMERGEGSVAGDTGVEKPLTPLEIMKKALLKECYDGLKVWC